MKKRYLPLDNVKEFLETQSDEIRSEYSFIVEQLEETGRLTMPYGEKLDVKNLFAMRVIKAGNVRVFYVYGHGDKVYGIYGYVKKTQKIPGKHMNNAKKILKLLKQRGMIK